MGGDQGQIRSRAERDTGMGKETGVLNERKIRNLVVQLSFVHYHFHSLRKITFFLAPFIREFQKEILSLGHTLMYHFDTSEPITHHTVQGSVSARKTDIT